MASNITVSNTSISLDNIKSSMGYEVSEQEEQNLRDLYDKHNNDINVVPWKYTYVPKMTMVFSNGDVLDLSDFISIIKTEINFTTHVFPLFSLQLFIQTTLIPKIQFDDDLMVKYELLYKSTEENTAMLYSTLFTITLSKVKQISSPVNIETGIVTDINDSYNRKEKIELKLIPTECLEANKVLFSGAYNSCNISTMIAYMSSMLNNKVFMQQPDNTEVYDQIIFPPTNIFYSLQYLDNYYGIYNKGLKLFYGFGLFRIQSNDYYDTEGSNTIEVHFAKGTNDTDIYQRLGNGIVSLGTDNLIVVSPERLQIVDTRHYMKEIVGTNLNTFSRTHENTYEIERDYNFSNTPSKTKSYVNNYNNYLKENEVFYKSIYTKTIVLSMDNVILDVSSWFKMFKIEFESNYYESMSGKYSLAGYSFSLVKSNVNTGSSFFTCTTNAILDEIVETNI